MPVLEFYASRHRRSPANAFGRPTTGGDSTGDAAGLSERRVQVPVIGPELHRHALPVLFQPEAHTMCVGLCSLADIVSVCSRYEVVCMTWKTVIVFVI